VIRHNIVQTKEVKLPATALDAQEKVTQDRAFRKGRKNDGSGRGVDLPEMKKREIYCRAIVIFHLDRPTVYIDRPPLVF
jgi:hypothetical protein